MSQWKQYLRFNRIEIIGGLLLGIIVAALVLSRLSHCIRTVPHEAMYDLMEKIYHKLDGGASDGEVINGLSFWERRTLRKYRIKWDSEAFPIAFPQGELVTIFYPIDHVVVYTEQLIEKEKGQQFGVFISGRFLMQWPQSLAEIESLLSVSRYGTFEILYGSVLTAEDCVHNFDPNKHPQLYSYLLLKNLVNGSNDYLRYALLMAARGDMSTSEWVNEILNASIISPKLPAFDLNIGKEHEFYELLSTWYFENAEYVKFDNSFLFYSGEQKDKKSKIIR